MSIYSKFLELSTGSARTVDLSTNTLSLGAMQLNGSTSGTLTHLANATTASYTLTWPAAVAAANGYLLSSTTAGVLTWIPAPSTGANTSLSNLSAVAINTSLLPGTTNSINLGSASFTWASEYVNSIYADPNTGVGQMFDATPALSLDWKNRLLVDSAGHTVLNWQTAQANDTSGIASVSFATRSTTDSSTNESIDWQNRLLIDSSGGIQSVNWGTRQLHDSAGTLQLSWSTSGVEINSASLNMNSNKIINLANGTNPNDAVNFSQLSSITSGFIWQNPINDPDLVNDSLTSPPTPQYTFTITTANATAGATYTNNSQTFTVLQTIVSGGGTTLVTVGTGAPSASGTLTKATGGGDPTIAFSAFSNSPIFSLVYIIGASPTGAWTGCAGHATWWNGTAWIDISTGSTLTSGLGTAVQVGDRYGVAMASIGGTSQVGGGLTGETNAIAVISNNTPGSIAYTFSTPLNNWAVSSTVKAGSQHFGQSYLYSTTDTAWINFGSTFQIIPGNALVFDGSTLNVLYDNTSIAINSSNELAVQLNASGAIVNSGGLEINLNTTNPGLAITSNKLDVKYNPAGAIVASSTGITTQVLSTGGIQISSNSLALLLADTSLSTNSSGVKVNLATSSGLVTSSGLAVQPDNTSIYINGSNQVAIKNTAYDQLTIVGGSGTVASVAYAPSVKLTGVYGGAATLSANRTYAMRWGEPQNGETANRLYVADWNTSSFDLFWVVGLYSSTGTTATGASITITNKGPYTLGSSDTTFSTSNDSGLPVWLVAAGAGNYAPTSTFAPSTGDANFKLGIVTSATTIWVESQMLGVS